VFSLILFNKKQTKHKSDIHPISFLFLSLAVFAPLLVISRAKLYFFGSVLSLGRWSNGLHVIFGCIVYQGAATAVQAMTIGGLGEGIAARSSHQTFKSSLSRMLFLLNLPPDRPNPLQRRVPQAVPPVPAPRPVPLGEAGGRVQPGGLRLPVLHGLPVRVPRLPRVRQPIGGPTREGHASAGERTEQAERSAAVSGGTARGPGCYADDTLNARWCT